MIKVTPNTEWHRYTGQAADEKNRLLADLQTNPGDYLAHEDSMIRAYADWALEYYGIRNLRNLPKERIFPANVHNASACLHRLYQRMREVQNSDWIKMHKHENADTKKGEKLS